MKIKTGEFLRIFTVKVQGLIDVDVRVHSVRFVNVKHCRNLCYEALQSKNRVLDDGSHNFREATLFSSDESDIW